MEETKVPITLKGSFCVHWRIIYLSHWSSEKHGDSVATSVPFDNGRVEFKLYPKSADGGRMDLHFPEQLWGCAGKVFVYALCGLKVAVLPKKEGQRVLPGLTEFEEFKRTYLMKDDNFVLYISLDNACKCKLGRAQGAITTLPVPPSQKPLSDDPRWRRPSWRRRRNIIIQERHSMGELVPSLEGLSIGDKPTEQKPTSVVEDWERSPDEMAAIRVLAQLMSLQRADSSRQTRHSDIPPQDEVLSLSAPTPNQRFPHHRASNSLNSRKFRRSLLQSLLANPGEETPSAPAQNDSGCVRTNLERTPSELFMPLPLSEIIETRYNPY